MSFSYKDFKLKANAIADDLHRAKRTHFKELENAVITSQPKDSCADIKIRFDKFQFDRLRIKPDKEGGLEVVFLSGDRDTGFNAPIESFSPTIYKIWLGLVRDGESIGRRVQ